MRSGDIKFNSSTSDAAELLHATSGLTNAPFIGFGQFAADDDEQSSASSMNLHPDLAVILRNLNKRDAVTKVKALEELQAFLFDMGSIASIHDHIQLLPYWSKLFTRLGIDVDRRVRVLTIQIHAKLLKSVHKKCSPHIADFIATWVLCMFDANKEVRQIAVDSFATMFPGTKAGDVLAMFQNQIMSTIVDYMTVKTPETLSDPRHTTEEDSESKYARTLAASIHSVCFMLESLDQSRRQPCASIYSLVLQVLWKPSQSEHQIVRRALYSVTKRMCASNLDVVAENMTTIAREMFSTMFLEKDMVAHEDMWDAFLSLCKCICTFE